jgi:hypothetical protein
MFGIYLVGVVLLFNLPQMRQKQFLAKGGLILESFSVWLKSPKIGAKSLP